MRHSINFRWVNEQISPLKAFELLDLTMAATRPGQWRGDCPGCGSKKTFVYTDNEGFYCHVCKGEGGDVIALARFAYDLPGMWEGANELCQLAGLAAKPPSTVRTSNVRTSKVRSTVHEPESERARREPQSRSSRGGGRQYPPPQPTGAFDPYDYAAKLDNEHELLVEAGADLDLMHALSIGVPKRGPNAGMVMIPVRDEQGTILCFVPMREGTFPPQLRTNVVPLRRKA